MSLRAPRRRISPRTKRRYRAFRNFLKRALGNSSQPEDKTNSNISVSVSDLKHKIVGIEKQLDQVSQHCRNLITYNDDSMCEKSIRSRQNSENCISLEKNVQRIKKPSETKLLYKSSENQIKSFVESDVTSKVYDVYCVDVGKQRKNFSKETKVNSKDVTYKRKIRKSNDELSVVKQNHPYLNRLNRSWAYETDKLSASAASFCSMVDKTDYSLHRYEKKHNKKEYNRSVGVKKSDKLKDQSKNNIQQLIRKGEESNERYRYRKDKKGLDKEFITDIIRKQYQPVKLFNRKDSALSQMSAPLCRDKDPTVHKVQEASELCSCCYNDPSLNDQATRSCSLSDVRSIYDTKLYNAKKNPRPRLTRNNQEYYNDSFYDLVPVKEKSSPKTRKKFTDDNTIPYDHCKEVPPSPRSLRPRLNLKAQHYEASENLRPYITQSRENDGGKLQNLAKNFQNNNIANDTNIGINNNNEGDIYPSTLHPGFGRNKTNLSNDDLSPNDTREKFTKVDKTDKALYEIKDILQNFLEEMKKETTQSDKSEESIRFIEKRKRHEENFKNLTNRNSLHSCHRSNISAQCTAACMNPFPNNYCYPILPVCPMPCVQNGGYPPVVISSHNNTCTACTTQCKEFAVQTRCEPEVPEETKLKVTGDDTQQLIKKIYNCVKQSTMVKENERCTKYQDVCSGPEPVSTLNKEVTSRSAGGSTSRSLHDIVISTSKTNCLSKSCEAFDRKNGDDASFIEGRYSDTVLEKFSLEAAATQPSDFDFSSILDVKVKPRKKKKFAKLLQSFGNLLKNKKNNVMKELSESESRITENEDVRPLTPYRQHMANYMMHGEEYYQQPPHLVPRRMYPPMAPEYSYRPPVGIDYRYGYPHIPLKHPYNSYSRMTPDPTLHYTTTPYDATSPSYTTTIDPRYNPVQSQVPVCLKEVEVKSSGTQSEKKVSFLEVLKKKMAGPKPTIDPAKEAESRVEQMTKKGGMLNWKKWQEKTIQRNSGQLNYTQKNFAETDMTVRDVLITRMFKKRNPLSSRNPLLQTLLGKDKPMKEPSNLLRPRIIV